MTQPSLGILMLKTRFPRPPGDVGNPDTWPFPVVRQVVEAATVDRVVNADPPVDLLLKPFVAGGQALVDAGAAAITTTCGFLAVFQDDLTQALPVPVLASSLQQAPLVQRSLPRGKRVGIISIDAGNLSSRHLAAAGVDPDTPVVGTEQGRELSRIILDDLEELDVAKAEADILKAGDALAAKAPELGAVVLECANMAPYSRALAQQLGVPVYDIVTMITWLHAGLAPRLWPNA
ncbi:MAG: aspartate/glutamate racemase family protein, partial [Alphaproteobacteria bacterium]